MTDFLLTNTDRHLNNFGFLYNARQHKLVSMTPIFDTGNALFYHEDLIPSKENLLDIPVTSFCKRAVELLRYVQNPDLLDLSGIEEFPDIARDLLQKYTDMPMERAEKLAGTIRTKMEYLQMFSQGIKIWKPKKYWQVMGK